MAACMLRGEKWYIDKDDMINVWGYTIVSKLLITPHV